GSTRRRWSAACTRSRSTFPRPHDRRHAARLRRRLAAPRGDARAGYGCGDEKRARAWAPRRGADDKRHRAGARDLGDGYCGGVVSALAYLGRGPFRPQDHRRMLPRLPGPEDADRVARAAERLSGRYATGRPGACGLQARISFRHQQPQAGCVLCHVPAPVRAPGPGGAASIAGARRDLRGDRLVMDESLRAVTRLREVITTSSVRQWMQRVTAVVLLGFGARLALERV